MPTPIAVKTYKPINLVGMLQHAKRDIGRSIGMLRQYSLYSQFIALDGQVIRELEKAYEKVKWAQDEIDKL